jgi:type II secretory ATPase GspE/PulE/Tfp pilus assembly ATPase PilB-like protein
MDDGANDATDEEDPVAKLVKLLFLTALHKGAAAFFVEPTDTSFEAWLVIDGVPKLETALPRMLHRRIVEQFRSMAGLWHDGDEEQVGEVRLRIGPARIEAFVVHIIPTSAGEKIVVDVLGATSPPS